MNYIGRAKKPGGKPKYEATYEINASLDISVPEFEQLVSHEVVPVHVTTFAYLQDLYVRGLVRLEATVLTMNTGAAALFEDTAKLRVGSLSHNATMTLASIANGIRTERISISLNTPMCF
jgi:hypothetical protein